VASWQALARKMAHEVKNSLTPIRLTVEEIASRQGGNDPFMEQASQIVTDEITTLEKKIKEFYSQVDEYRNKISTAAEDAKNTVLTNTTETQKQINDPASI